MRYYYQPCCSLLHWEIPLLFGSHPPQLALQGTYFLTHPRHHLPHESKAEQHHARDHEHHDQVEERAETEVRGAKAQIQRHEANDEAHREEHRPDHAEKQHRFAREADLEPDGHQIEHAHRNTSDPEFRATRAPRMHRHRPLGEAEPLRGGDHHHEAMPIGPHRYDVHDLAAIRLHGVQVLHPHAEQPTAQRVVNPRNEAL